MASKNNLEVISASKGLQHPTFTDKQIYRSTLFNVRKLCRELKTGKSVEIPSISETKSDVYNHQLLFFPNGDTEENKDNAAFYLKCRTNFHVILKFSLIIQNSAETTVIKVNAEHDFNNRPLKWEYQTFLERKTLLLFVASNDAIKIQIHIRINYELGIQWPINRDFDFQKKLSKDLELMMNDKNFCDFILRVGNSEIKVHRNILATRSPVLSAMLEYDTLEKNTGYLEINDVDENTVELLIYYIYTGKVDIKSNDEAQKLLIAADKYCLMDLKLLCGDYLRHNLSVHNVLDILLLSDLYNAVELKRNALHLIGKNFSKFCNPAMFETVLRCRPELLLDIILKVASVQTQEQKSK